MRKVMLLILAVAVLINFSYVMAQETGGGKAPKPGDQPQTPGSIPGGQPQPPEMGQMGQGSMSAPQLMQQMQDTMQQMQGMMRKPKATAAEMKQLQDMLNQMQGMMNQMQIMTMMQMCGSCPMMKQSPPQTPSGSMTPGSSVPGPPTEPEKK